ncbi:hypothetical protein [Bdellovibrio bacteriovorus]|uniref:hypothetical protein n=1 Tax=Bdellovibrio bacteriovorus TaxID=959 RepID=UPI0035A67A71
MKKVKVGLVGASGRMGQEIVKVIEANPRCEVFYAFDREMKYDTKKAAAVDVWIDFSSPDALKDVLKRAADNKTPVVCGTTGFSKKEKDLLAQYGKKNSGVVVFEHEPGCCCS